MKQTYNSLNIQFCIFCIVERHVQCAQSPMHLVEYRSIWQQSVALFNELWEQKLIINFNYCLQQH